MSDTIKYKSQSYLWTLTQPADLHPTVYFKESLVEYLLSSIDRKLKTNEDKIKYLESLIAAYQELRRRRELICNSTTMEHGR